MSYKYAIVGMGPAGILFLASLPKEELQHTLVLEANMIGGDLATEYGDVIANITNANILKTFMRVERWSYAENPFPLLSNEDEESCPKLSLVMKQMCQLILPDIKQTTFHNAKLIESEYNTTTARWQLKTDNKRE